MFWEIPGWLAAQYDLYVPDKFNLNLKSLNVPEFLIISDDETAEQDEGEINLKTQFEASMDLSSQVIITDLLFQNELNKHIEGNHYRDLYIRYKVETTSGTFQGFTVDPDITVDDNGDGSYDIPCKWHNYQDDVITAFVNCSPVWWMDNPKDKDNPQNYDGVIAVTAYPIIKYNRKILEFTQFKTELRFPLNTLKNSNNITIADSIYKWSVDDDSCTISFNINGPFINASDITGKYEIYRINLFKKQEETTNPKSYSTWSEVEKPNKEADAETAYLDKNDKKRKSIKYSALNSEVFYQSNTQSQLLMCEGRLSNLVLYGQNTININWSNSDQYTLNGYRNWYTDPDKEDDSIKEDPNYNKQDDKGNYIGSKTIDFSKEGGIYIFRVILKQGTQELAVNDSILIPSEVFNEWFGSIDDYNNIYENQWISQIKNTLLLKSFDIINIKPEYSNNNIKLEKKINEKTELVSCNVDNADEFVNILLEDEVFKTEYQNKKYTIFVNLNCIVPKFNITQTLDYPTYNQNLWNANQNFQISFDNLKLNFVEKNENIYIYDVLSDENLIDFTFNFQILDDKFPVIHEDGHPFKSPPTYRIEATADGDIDFKIHAQTNWGAASTKTESAYKSTKGPFSSNSVFINGEKVFDDIEVSDNNKTHKTNMAEIRVVGNIISTLLRNYCGCVAKSTKTKEACQNIEYNTYLVRGDDINYKNCLMFRSANKSGDQALGGVIVRFGNIEKAENALKAIKFRSYENTESILYYDQILNKLSLKENYIKTLSKVIYALSISQLRVDDQIYFFNNKLIDIDENFDSNLLQTNQQDLLIFNSNRLSISPYILTLNLQTNDSYKALYLYMNSAIIQYNNKILGMKEDKLEKNEGLYLPEESNEHLEFFNNIKSKFAGINGNSMSLSKIGWMCSEVNSFMYAYSGNSSESIGKIGKPRSNNGGSVCIARYDTYEF